MQNRQLCARWGCEKPATYDKPLCYKHWEEWEDRRLDECSRCHWICDTSEFALYDLGVGSEEPGPMCNDCMASHMLETGMVKPSQVEAHRLKLVSLMQVWVEAGHMKPEDVLPYKQFSIKPKPPVPIRIQLKRRVRYVYVLKLSDGTFYVGQTNNLEARLAEHRDGRQQQTQGKEPKLVYFSQFEGARGEVIKLENELTRLNQTEAGQRRLREIIEEFRNPLRSLDLDA